MMDNSRVNRKVRRPLRNPTTPVALPHRRLNLSEQVGVYPDRSKKKDDSTRRRRRGLPLMQLDTMSQGSKARKAAFYTRTVPERPRRRHLTINIHGPSGTSCSNSVAGPHHSPRAFSMLTLDEYLRERSRFLHQVDGNCTNSSRLSCHQKMSCFTRDLLRRRMQKMGTTRKSPMTSQPFRSLNSKTSTNPHLLHDFPSAQIQNSSIPLTAEGADDDIGALTVQSQGCGVPWQWYKSQAYRGKGLMDLADKSYSCGFPVSRRRNSKKMVPRRRSTLRAARLCRYKSEKSISPSDSSSETTPLLSRAQLCQAYGESTAEKRHLHSQYRRRAGRPDRSTRLEDTKKPASFRIEEANGYGVVRHREYGEAKVKHRSLSQKYRPKSFKEMVGQNMAVQALSNAIIRDKIAPVYLFQGSRGTGKTTAARIFAAAMNCLSTREERPCGVCRECKVGAVGRNFDVREVDAAGNNSMESMKALLKLVGLRPLSSKYKVFIIDECHMLTKEAWNVFLKSLEEPPSYVVFILITTDPDQLPRAVMSRCQKFPFPKIKDADIAARLRKLARLEKVDIEWEALELITAKSDGSLRDAETTLDQLSILGRTVTTSMVRELVGLVAHDKLEELLDLALSGDTVNTVRCIRELMESGVEPLALMSQLATLITDLLAGDMSAKDTSTRNVFWGHNLSKDELEKLRQALKILSDAEKQLRSCKNRATWLTTAILQFCPMDKYLPPASSLGTSVTQSPMNFVDTSEKETDPGIVKLPWKGQQLCENSQLYLISKRETQKNRAAMHTSIDFSCSLSQISYIDESFRRNGVNQRLHYHPGSDIVIAGDDLQESMLRYSGDVSEVGCKNDRMLGPRTMENIWRKVLEGIRSDVLRQFLSRESQLLSISISEADAIAHLEFRFLEDKLRAEKAEESITNAFETALGCPVKVKLSLASSPAVEKSVTFMNRRDPSQDPEGMIESEWQSEESRSLTRRTYHESSHLTDMICFERSCHPDGPSSPESYRGSKPHQSESHYRQKEQPLPSNRTEDNVQIRGGCTSARSKAFEVTDVQEEDGSVDEYNSQDVQDDQQDASLRTERDSDDSDYSKTLAELERKAYYEQKDRTNGFRNASYTRLLCWKGFRIKEPKVKRHKSRRRKKLMFLLKFMPCANPDSQY